MWRKLLIVKLLCVCLFLQNTALSASVYSQELKLTLKGNDISLTNIFSQIRKSSDYTFVYNLDDIQNVRVKSLDVKDASIREVFIVDVFASSLKDAGGGTLRMLTDAAYMPSVEEIAAYGLDETGLINKYLDQFRQVEQERGPSYVAQQMALNEFGYGYGFVWKVNTGEIDNSKVYLQDMALKAQRLLNSKIAGATGDTKIHYQSLLMKLNKSLKDSK